LTDITFKYIFICESEEINPVSHRKGQIMELSTSTPQTAEITPETPYGVIDNQTGSVVYKTTYKNRKRARSIADRMDNKYGAYRYFPKFLEVK